MPAGLHHHARTHLQHSAFCALVTMIGLRSRERPQVSHLQSDIHEKDEPGVGSTAQVSDIYRPGSRYEWRKILAPRKSTSKAEILLYID